MKQLYLHLCTAALFVYLALFFCFFHPYHLLYAEQLQLFQYTMLYFQSAIAKPGGLMDYAGTFLMQFYAINHVGGLFIVAALAGLFALQRQIAKRWNCPNIEAFALIPIVAFALFFRDTNAHLGAWLSVMVSLSAAYGASLMKRGWMRRGVAMLLIPLVYAATAGGVLLYATFFVMSELMQSRGRWLFLLALMLSALALPLAVRHYMLPLSWNDTWFGSAYYRGVYQPSSIWILLFIPLLPLVLARLTAWLCQKERNRMICSMLLIVCLLGGSAYSLHQKKLRDEEVIYTLHHLLRQQDWDGMLHLAERSPQRNLVFVSYVNLALLNKGQLPDKLLHFAQRKGVNEFWTSAYLPMFLTGETYYYLNMPHAARSYLFMANTQSPLGQSPFLLQRLAELEVINGDPRSGLKMVEALKHTLFYRHWAEQMEQAIRTKQYPTAMQNKIEGYRQTDAFLAKEMLYNVSCRLQAAPGSRKVQDFLLSKQLLASDYKGFVHTLSMLPNGIGREWPRMYYEFLMMYAYLLSDSALVQQWHIPQEVATSFQQYVEINQSNQPKEAVQRELHARFGHSYWYYMQYKDQL